MIKCSLTLFTPFCHLLELHFPPSFLEEIWNSNGIWVKMVMSLSSHRTLEKLLSVPIRYYYLEQSCETVFKGGEVLFAKVSQW